MPWVRLDNNTPNPASNSTPAKPNINGAAPTAARAKAIRRKPKKVSGADFINVAGLFVNIVALTIVEVVLHKLALPVCLPDTRRRE
jgi:hypothetical protein